jgi:hypothetical protein
MSHSTDKKDELVNAKSETDSAPGQPPKNSERSRANRLVIVAIVGVFAIGVVAFKRRRKARAGSSHDANGTDS